MNCIYWVQANLRKTEIKECGVVMFLQNLKFFLEAMDTTSSDLKKSHNLRVLRWFISELAHDMSNFLSVE